MILETALNAWVMTPRPDHTIRPTRIAIPMQNNNTLLIRGVFKQLSPFLDLQSIRRTALKLFKSIIHEIIQEDFSLWIYYSKSISSTS